MNTFFIAIDPAFFLIPRARCKKPVEPAQRAEAFLIQGAPSRRVRIQVADYTTNRQVLASLGPYHAVI